MDPGLLLATGILQPVPTELLAGAARVLCACDRVELFEGPRHLCTGVSGLQRVEPSLHTGGDRGAIALSEGNHPGLDSHDAGKDAVWRLGEELLRLLAAARC